MKVLYHINYYGLGADRWISGGYRDAFQDLGHEFFYVYFHEDLGTAIDRIRPEILFIVPTDYVLDHSHWGKLRDARKRGTKIFLMADQTCGEVPEKIRLYRDGDVADVYWGENEAEWMQDFVGRTGREYVTIPLAANRKYHFPTSPAPKYECDIAYLGAIMPFKREAFQKLLLPLKKRYRVRIYGPGWTIKDRVLRFSAVALRKLNVDRLSTWITKHRVTVPPEEENQLYSSAKICVNIHERGPEQKNHVFLNERGFKIPACGGFEICDFNRALRRYFTADEVVMTENDDDWFRKIDYFLHHEDERLKIKEAGTHRVHRDHTYHHRVQLVLELARS